jgi:catechol 2,3-dioxygenase-like lactoylglutathione lyase family enzyme
MASTCSALAPTSSRASAPSTVTFASANSARAQAPADPLFARSIMRSSAAAAFVPLPERSAVTLNTVVAWGAFAGSSASLRRGAYRAPVHIELVTIIVDDYDAAIRFFVDALAFELVEDSPSTTNDGRPKRWVVVRPPGSATGILLARADGESQRAAVGRQMAGRVGFFLRVEDFDAAYRRMIDRGVELVSEPRTEPYGQVAVFLDIAGNRWDLLGPRGGSLLGRGSGD